MMESLTPLTKRRMRCEECQGFFTDEGPWPSPQWDGNAEREVYIRAECPTCKRWVTCEMLEVVK